MSAALLLIASGAVAASVSPPEATAYQITPEHAGVTTSGGVISFQQAPLWTFPVTGAASYPLIAGGRVFLTYRTSSNNFAGNQLVALDAQSGQLLWGPISIGVGWAWTNATYDAGILFVLDRNGHLQSFDAATGVPGWTTTIPGQWIFSSPPTARNGLVYLAGSGIGGRLFAVDEATGSVIWASMVQNGDNSAPVVTADGVYVSYACARTYDFNPANGSRIWLYQTGCQGGGGRTAAYANGRLYVRDPGSPNYILAGESGVLAGNFAADPIPAIGPTRGYFLQGGVLQGRDSLSQSVAWSFSGDGNLVSAPIAIDEYVFAGSGLGNLYALDAATGQQRWSTNVGAAIPAPDERGASQPLTGLGAANGILVVPTASKVVGYSLFDPGAYPDQAIAYGNVSTRIDALANDIGFRDPMSVALTGAPAHGVATVTGSPGSHFGMRISYTADALYTGPDNLTYQVSDGTRSGSATVAIDVRAAEARDDAVTTSLSTASSIDVLANDSGFNDPVTVTLPAGPAHGSAVVAGSPGNQAAIRIDYTPNPGYSGADSLTYQVSDGVSTASATVAITVLSFKAKDDSYRVYRGATYTPLHVPANDTGFGTPMTVEIQAPPDRGGLATVSGSPGAGWQVVVNYSARILTGPEYTERFTYRVSDGVHTATAAVNVLVVDYIAQNDSGATGAGVPVTIPVGANDIGFASPATVTIDSPASNGSLVVNGSPGPPGAISITYQPEPGFDGYDGFRYEMSDGTRSWIASVNVHVYLDTDGDGVAQESDNCTLVPNPDQFDADGDGYGNICDPDLNNSGLVTTSDYTMLRKALNTSDPVADLDNSGLVTTADFMILRSMLNKPPGPSGYYP